jgi:hypothetical protein
MIEFEIISKNKLNKFLEEKKQKLMLNLHKYYISILPLEIIIILNHQCQNILHFCHHQEKEIYKTETHFG